MRGEQADQPLIPLGEAARLGLAGGEDEAEDLVTFLDRHAQDVGELGVRLGPAPEPRIGADVVQPQRLALAEHDAQHAVLAGQRADRRLLARSQPVDHELGERAGSSGTPSAAYLAPASDRAERTIICRTSRTESWLATASTTWLTRWKISSWPASACESPPTGRGAWPIATTVPARPAPRIGRRS